MKKEVFLLVGAGQIGLAIARRMAHGMTIVLGDLSETKLEQMSTMLREAGFEVITQTVNLALRKSIEELIATATSAGTLKHVVNAAGVSPSQATVETILKVDLYGTAVLLEEAGKVIARGAAGLPSPHSQGTACRR